MDAEYLKIHIANALDMLQVITEDIEENIMRPQQTAYMSNRASLAISCLTVVYTYLKDVCEGVVK